VGELFCHSRWYKVGKLVPPPIVRPRVTTRTICPARQYQQWIGTTVQSGNDPEINLGSKSTIAGDVSPVSLRQNWQLRGSNTWQPLGPVSEISLVKQPIDFSVSRKSTGGHQLHAVLELPEWSQLAGTPAAIYVGVNISYGYQQVFRELENWKCEFNVGQLFDQGVSIADIGSFLNAWGACYVVQITGNLLAKFEVPIPRMSVTIDAFFVNAETDALSEAPINLTMFAQGEATQVLPMVNLDQDAFNYRWEKAREDSEFTSFELL